MNKTLSTALTAIIAILFAFFMLELAYDMGKPIFEGVKHDGWASVFAAIITGVIMGLFMGVIIWTVYNVPDMIVNRHKRARK